jgi:hypothetical protein
MVYTLTTSMELAVGAETVAADSLEVAHIATRQLLPVVPGLASAELEVPQAPQI